jgi:hypothetical protein
VVRSEDGTRWRNPRRGACDEGGSSVRKGWRGGVGALLQCAFDWLVMIETQLVSIGVSGPRRLIEASDAFVGSNEGFA